MYSKKFLIIVVICMSLACIGGLLFVMTRDDADAEDSITESSDFTTTEIETTTQPVNKPTQGTTTQTTTVDRTIQPSSITIIEKETSTSNNSDVLDLPIDIPDIEQGYAYYFNKTESSKGFVIKSSDIVTAYSMAGTYCTCIADNGKTKIYVSEPENGKTIQQARKDLLIRYNFGYYMSLSPLEIPIGTEYELGVGIPNYKNFFEQRIDRDLTINGAAQIISDCIVTTNIGNMLYIELYELNNQIYSAYAYVNCNDGRVLNIRIHTGTTKAYDYMMDTINNVIVLIN